jgi:hypothetical protein
MERSNQATVANPEPVFWQPRVGGACTYTLMGTGASSLNLPATIVAVRQDWRVDLDIQLGGRFQRHYRVPMARGQPKAHTWRLSEG